MNENTILLVQAIKAIPRGKVSSYGAVAKVAGIPNGARQTVRVLHSMSEIHNLPWHRVVRADGKIALKGEGKKEQIALLQAEGVKVSESGQVGREYFMKPVHNNP